MKQKGKKTIVCVLLCVLVCMVSAFALAGCKKTEAPKKYSVIFMNGDTQISEQTVEANKEAVKPDDPTKESSVSTVYTFAGWALTADGEVVTDFTIKADTTFYAVYTPSARKYTVKFMDGENQLSSVDVNYDAQATKPADPTKAADAKYTYTFAGWALTADGDAVTDFKVTGDVTYYAVYTSVVNKYDVKFMLDGEQIGATQNIDYDTAPTMPEAPTKVATAEYTYTFAGWYTAAEGGEKVEDFTVKGNATYYGRFTATKNRYEIKFVDGDGNQVDATQTVEYGTAANAPATATKTATDKYTYAFDGWYTAAEGGEKVTDFTVKANATYYAHFTSTVNKYDVKFMSEGQQVGETQSVEYDAKATKPANPTKTGDAQYSYDFEGWYNAAEGGEKVEDFTVKGNATYYGRFTAVKNKYTVKFIDGNGEEMTENAQTLDYGSEIELPAEPAAESGYYFAGWKTEGGKFWQESDVLEKNETLTATFEKYFGTILDDCVYGIDYGVGGGFAVSQEKVAGFEKVYEQEVSNDWQTDLSHVSIADYKELRFAVKSDAQITSDKFSSGAVLFDGGVWYTFVLTSIEGGWNVKVLGTEYDYTHFNPDGRGICAVLFHGTSGWGFGVRAGGTAGAYKVYCTELRGEKKIVPVVGTIVDDCVYGTDPGIGAGFAVTKSEVALGFEKAYERDIDKDWQAELSHVDISAYSELRFALKTDGKISSDSAGGAVLFDGGVWYTFVLTKVENGWNVKVLGTDYNYTHVAPGGRGVCDIVYHGTNGWGLGVRLNGAATPCKVYCTELRGVIGSEA